MSATLVLATLLHLADTCVPKVGGVLLVHPSTLLSVLHTESGERGQPAYDPLAIGTNPPSPVPTQPDEATATATARRFIAAGLNPDLGIAQLNWNAGHLQRRGLTVADAFRPCTALRVAAEILSDCWTHATSGDEQVRLRAAIGCYNAGHPVTGTAYVRQVEASARLVVPAIAITNLPAPPVVRPGAAPSSVPQHPGWLDPDPAWGDAPAGDPAARPSNLGHLGD